MTTPMTSTQWHRVASLHPRLRGHVRIKRQTYRKERWYLLTDGLTGQTHRINRIAYGFVGRCNGDRRVGDIWETLLDIAPDDAPTQDEVIDLLIRLHQRGLVQCEQTPEVEQLFRARAKERRQAIRHGLNPLSFKVALFDPSSLLARLDFLPRHLFSLPALLIWLSVVTAGLFATANHWAALQAHAIEWLSSAQGVLLMFLSFPLIKALHELAHGLAVRRWGGEVHKAGITLLVLNPVPFVDASAASAFRSTGQRMAVSAAGIMLELFLAAIAILLWTQIQPGLVRDLALVVATICGISTLAFNGNPLLRFDGYYIFSDALNLPNLASRSTLFWRYLILRHALRLHETPTPSTADGEKPWLFIYAPLSLAYRIGLSIVIIGWIGSWSAALGLLVALATFWSLIVKPLALVFHNLRSGALPEAQQHRAMTGAAIWGTVLVLLIGIVPLPFATVAQGVVWVPENVMVRPESGGFIKQFNRHDGESVVAGDLLATLDDPALHADGDRLRNEIRQRETELYQLMLRDPVAANNLNQHLARLSAELTRTEERIARLEIRAQVAGRLAMPHQPDILGTYAAQGKALGFIITDDPATLRVAISQDAAALVQNNTRNVGVRLAETPGQILDASLKAATPAASERLPSAALGDRSNGPHVVDPADKEHTRTREPVFLIDLALPIRQGDHIGGRAWVRFEHAATPLAMQWGRRLQQLFLHNFDQSG